MARYRKVVTKTIDEWLAIRKPRIGGSEISAVLGINPFESKYELYMRKTGEMGAKEENLAMRLGHKLENAVAELLQEEAGYQIIKNTAGNLIYLSEDYPFAEASPDRLAYLPGAKKSKDNLCLVEIKTTQRPVDPDDIPDHWYCQIQWYLGILGLKTAVLAWLVGGRDFGWTAIEFNGEFFQYLVGEGAKFADDLKNGVVPEAVTAGDVALRYPKQVDGKVVEVSEEVALACEDYKKVCDELKALDARKNELSEVIKVAIADSESITYGGLTLATFKASKDSLKFDAKAFQAENPELAGKYMKNVPGGRSLRVK